MADFSEDRFRDRITRHMTRRPAPVRPADYGAQSPRLLTELTDGIRAENVTGRSRIRFDNTVGFVEDGAAEATPGTRTAQELIGSLVDAPAQVAGDRDVFGGPMLVRAMDRVRRSGRPQPGANAISARNDAALAAASEELELRATGQPTPQSVLKAHEILEAYPDMTPEDAFALAAADETDETEETA